ncbi:MAG: inositol monophosphatase [Eubacterium sp.]|nr:inositol monophosphatase [Eubacterium sp.]
MTDSVLQQNLEEIVREAAAFMTREFDVTSKGTIANQVTSSDVAVENFLKESLQTLLPGSSFIAEESDHGVKDAEYTWIIDPIDGTANYVRDLGASGISVGLYKHMEPFIGVVYNPYRDELFSARKGAGAFCNGRQIHVSDRDFAHSCFCTSLSCYYKNQGHASAQVLEQVFMQCDDFRRFGAAVIELTALAAGRVELYFEMSLAPWDHGASRVIIEEAGGCVANVYAPQINYGGQTSFIAANNPENLEKLRQIILQVAPQRIEEE